MSPFLLLFLSLLLHILIPSVLHCSHICCHSNQQLFSFVSNP